MSAPPVVYLMATRDEVNALRAEARKRHRAATRKVSRLKAKGVQVSGTDLDPRRDLGKLKNYTVSQVKTYLSELNSFVSRETQYVGGIKNRPLAGNLWQQYKALESQFNAATMAKYESIKDTPIPSHGDGMTVAGLQAMKPDHPLTGNPASRAPHLPINRSPKGVQNDKQIKKLIRDMKNRLRSDYADKVLARDRQTALKMLDPIGDKDIAKAVREMDNDKFHILWGYTRFAEVASFDYLIARSHMHGKGVKSWHNDAFKTQINQMKKTINDVEKQEKLKVDED